MKAPKVTKSQKINELVSELFSGQTLHEAESDDETTGVKIAEFDHREHDGSDDEDDVQLDNQISEFRKKNLVLLNEVDEKYRGSVVSRKDLESDEEVQEENEESGDDEQYQIDDDNEQSEDDDDNEQSEDDDDDELSEDEDDDGQISDEVTDNSDEAESENESKGSEEGLERNTQVIFGKQLSGKSNAIKKGLAVQNQLKIWEHLLELRIHSQKLLTNTNSLPPHNILNEMARQDEDLAKEMESLHSGTLNLLDNLCEIQRILLNKFSETKSIEMKKPHRKRKYEDNLIEYSNTIEHNYGKYKPYGDATIQKWYDRTKVFSNNLKSKTTEDANIIHRIDTILVNKGDLIKKSQLHKGGYELFNPDINKTIRYEVKEAKQILDMVEPENQTSDSVKVLQDKNIYSTEIYDDTDFYHQLLRGLIEFKTSTLTNPQEISKQYSELEKLRKKMKKVVDTRASKGRKLRYVVHKKLVNFMAPNPHCEWTNEARDELFTSLFGKLDNKISSNNE